MAIIGQIFNTVFYQPTFNLLVWLYNVVPGHDIGVAIILVTLFLRFVLFPFSLQSLKSQRALNSLQPKLKAIQTQYKDDKEKQARATMELYAAEKVSPFSSCLPLIAQLPFIYAINHALQSGLLSGKFDLLYPFVQSPGTINASFVGLLDLAAPSIPLAVLAGLATLWQMLMLSPKPKPAAKVPGSKDEDTLAAVNRQMTYIMPIMTFVLCLRFSGALSLYWLVTTLFTVGQQWLFFQRPAKMATPPGFPDAPTPPASPAAPAA